MKKRWIALIGIGVVVACVGLFNASFRAPAGDGAIEILAHRGVHQRFSREGLTNETCTAAQMIPPTHSYLENTIPSIREAFRLGADMIEIDVHPTTDGDFAVFHDWTIDCRTEGTGETRSHSMAYLRTLDVGYGYTADGGVTYPFRGQGVGLVPSLREVLEAFPEGRFLINFKSRDPDEGALMAAYLNAMPNPPWERLAFFGAAPATQVRALEPQAQVASRRMLMACARDYVLLGWSGHLPDACRNTLVFVPANYGWAVWGFPNLFLERMERAGSTVYLVAPVSGRPRAIEGIDTAAQFEAVPAGWSGGIVTDAVEVVAPLVDGGGE